MTLTIDTTDQRTAKALELLASADRWLKIRRKSDGAKFYAMPSSDGQHVYWTNLAECSCPDSQHRGIQCKHRIAVALHVAQVNAQPKRRAPKPAAPRSDFLTAASIGGLVAAPEAARLRCLADSIWGTDGE